MLCFSSEGENWKHFAAGTGTEKFHKITLVSETVRRRSLPVILPISGF